MNKIANINFGKEYENEIKIMEAYDKANKTTKLTMLKEIEKHENLSYLAKLMKSTL